MPDLLDNNSSSFPPYSFQSHSTSSNNIRTEINTNNFPKKVAVVQVDPNYSDSVIAPMNKPDPDSLLSTTGNTSLPDSNYSGSSTTPDVVGYFNTTTATTTTTANGRKDLVTSSAPKIKIQMADDNDDEVFLDRPDQYSSPDRLTVQEEQKKNRKHSAPKIGHHFISSNTKI